jgi:hypothetical protein
MGDLRRGFGLVIGFVEDLQIVTTTNYSAITNSHTLKFTTARTPGGYVGPSTGLDNMERAKVLLLPGFEL